MQASYPHIEYNGDTALTIVFEQVIDLHVVKQVVALELLIKQNQPAGLVELIPAFASLTLVLDLLVTDLETVKQQVQPLLRHVQQYSLPDLPLLQLPVCYHPSLAIDLDELANYCGLTPTQVINIHQQTRYHVYMTGFMPGFLYLGKLDQRIVMPRKTEPRTHIDAGAVGIAGEQTGIYPFASPGGWQIIGQTPLSLFDSQRKNSILAQPLQPVEFVEISLQEFEQIKGQQA